jgi:glycosyltransferase involved in cell wall biosynthesis
MKIIYDARWTRTDTHDGISRYGANVLEALAKQHPVTMLICNKRQLALLPDIPYKIVNNPMSPLELLLPFRLNKLGAEVVFSPLQIMGSWGRRYKLILTLQDLIYYRNPKPPTFLPAPVRLVWWLFHQAYWPQRLLLKRADYITTVSKTSKKLIQQHELTTRPIGVIYNAPPKLKKPSKPKKIKKELVYMGSFMPYKNVELLLRALPLLPDYKLHLASRIAPERKAELLRLIPRKRQVTFWNGASDEQYARMLSTATALVSASKDEGFGLPLIEAMELGTPVVCSDITIFHEVGGDSALFFDPESPESFVACIRSLESKALRQELIKKGRAQAKRFSWDKSAAELLKIMRHLTAKK